MRAPKALCRAWRLLIGVCVVSVLLCSQAWPQSAPEIPAVESTEQRLRALEEQNRELSGKLERQSQAHDAEIRELMQQFWQSTSAAAYGTENAASDGMTGLSDVGDLLNAPEAPVPDYTEGMFAPFTPAPGYPGSNATSSGRMPLRARFGPGFQLQTYDEQFSLQIHYESQVEARVWDPSRDNPANSGFFLPRQRFFFNGTMTKNVEYEVSINRGVNNINLLNAYLNFHFDDALEVRIGRFFTPFNYDQYAVSNYWLLTPERSLFTTNLSLNRQIGAMAWGYLFDKRLDYAVGAFNGGRNSFESLHNGVDVVGFLNVRPFQESETLPWLMFLNLGASVAYGQQDQAPSPATFRIGAGSPDTAIPSTATTPFLVLNPGVSERGDRLLGTVHAAYFFKSLSLIGEWQYGSGGYAAGPNPSMQVPFAGYYVAGGYFLTGEHIERRTRLKPLRPFLPLKKDETRGPGAWEAVARVSRLHVGDEIFNGGFADPNAWSNSATTTEVGMNWYWNDYLKFYAFWLHGEFGDPVQFGPGDFQQSVEMFWLRCQLYF